MAGVLTQIDLSHVSGKPEDKVVHTFAGTHPGTPDTSELDSWAARIYAWYVAAHTGPKGPENFLSGLISRAPGSMVQKSYIIPVVRGLFGSPDHVVTTALPAAQGAMPWPEEMAVVVSRHALLTDVAEEGAQEQIPTPRRAIAMGAPATHLGTPRPAARRRGRMFFGPLNDGARDGAQGAAVPPIVSGALQLALVEAEKTLADSVGGIQLGVFSRRDWVVRECRGGFVDNAFDVQRRRGHRSTARSLWNAA